MGTAVVFSCIALSIPASGQQAGSRGAGGPPAAVETLETEAGVLEPAFPGPALETARRPSRAEVADLERRLFELREALAAKAKNDFAGPPGGPGLPGREEDQAEETIEHLDFLLEEPDLEMEDDFELEGTGDTDPVFDVFGEVLPPEALVVKRNKINTVVPTGAAFKSSLGEPAVANVGKRVFYTGNTFASFSTDRGRTWTERSFPAPPFGGAIMCCDQDVEYAEGRNRVFWSMLWLNAAVTRGVVQIAVLNRPDRAPACVYNIGFGATVIPDYPHIGLSNDFLYLSTNNIDTSGPFWAGSQMRRFNLDQMAACQSASFDVFVWGTGPQRVFVPVEGATDVMSWGFLDDPTTFRIFEWPETTTTVTTTTKSISASPLVNPDCSGGVGNNDFIEKFTAWGLLGFRVRGWYGQPNRGGGRLVIGWLWNVGPDGSHPQGHIHAAVFDARTKKLIGEPHIWNSNFCFGYPDVVPTERGHPAIVLAFGGQAGGGGTAANTAVLLGDDTVTGGGPFGPKKTVATGTHNRGDGRYGDYFTIQQHSPCDLFLTAGSYVLSGGSAGSNAEHHYVNFGRKRDVKCFNRWSKK